MELHVLIEHTALRQEVDIIEAILLAQETTLLTGHQETPHLEVVLIEVRAAQCQEAVMEVLEVVALEVVLIVVLEAAHLEVQAMEGLLQLALAVVLTEVLAEVLLEAQVWVEALVLVAVLEEEVAVEEAAVAAEIKINQIPKKNSLV